MRLISLGLLLAVLVGSQPAAAQSTPRDPRFGAVQAINSPEKAGQAGVAWERIMFPWTEIQPGGPNEMRPGYYTDDRITAQARRGIHLVGVIVYTPGWAAEDPAKGWGAVPKGLDRPHTDPQNTFARYVNQLATKYKGTVDSWIIWNEPDLLIDFETKESPTWAGTERQFYQLLKSGYLAIKQANPQAKVLMPGFSHWHAKEAKQEPYLKRLLDIAAADPSAPVNNWYFDGVPTHAYANPLNSFALPTLYRRMLAERGLQNKGVWIIESNAVPWDDPTGLLPREPWRASMDEQASYVIQAFALGLAADIERMSIYKMRDEFPEDGQNFGLVREDGTTRPAYTALKTAIEHYAGAKKAIYTWNGSQNPPSKAEIDALLDTREKKYQYVWPGQVNQVSLERDGQRVTVLWNVTRRPLVGVVTAGASEAALLDAYGRTTPIKAQDGVYKLYLAAARANTEPRDKDLILVAGRPQIIVEKLGNNARASQPPRVEEGLRFENGFSVANAQFADYYKLRGGKNTFGLPITREFDLQGAPTQIFQRQVMQLTEDGGVRTLNLLDADLMPYTRINGSVLPAADDALKAQTPGAADREYADKIVRFIREKAPDAWQSKPVGFGRTFFSSVTCADAFPGSKCEENLLPLFNLEVWGAPISNPAPDPANGDFIYQRFQRGVLHHDTKCGCTQGLLLGEYFKAIITGQGLPPDLEEQAKDSPYFKQYDQTRVQGMSRPGALLRSNFKDAFEVP